MNSIGFHFVDQVYSASQRQQWIHQLKRIRPKFIVVLAGAQFVDAVHFVREVRQHVPQTRVIIRHYKDGGDDGMWQRIEPQDYIDRIGAIYTNALAGVDGWYLMPDNEFSTSHPYELELYLDWMEAWAEAAANAGINGALGCSPAWHPRPNQVINGEWDRLWALFQKYPQHIYYRNAYYSANNPDALKYVQNTMHYVKKQRNGFTPPLVIGEFARLLGPGTAHHGYRSIQPPISRMMLAQEAFAMFDTYLKDVADAACWYCIGEWPIGHDTFNIAQDTAFFDVLAARASKPVPPPPPPPDPTPDPEPEPDDTRISELLARVGTLETERETQEVAIAELQNRVAKLENLLLSHAVKTSETYKKAG